MAVQRRQSAASKVKDAKAEAVAPVQTRSQLQGGNSVGPPHQQSPPGGQLLLTAAALFATVACAAREWPIYMAYEKDWRRPALGFGLDLGVTTLVVLAVTLSPPVRALKHSKASAAAAAAPPAAAGASTSGPPQTLSRSDRQRIIAAALLIMMAMYAGFGAFGPCGALTTAAMCAFMFLALP